MALTLPWLTAAVLWVSPLPAWAPPPPLIESVVARVVNDTATGLAARRGFRLSRPLPTRLVDRAQMAGAARASDADSGAAAPATQMLRQTLFLHLGLAAQAHSLQAPPRGEDVTGLFERRDQSLLIAMWTDLATGRFALTRDIAHALLDRRFDLGRWLRVPPARAPAGAADAHAAPPATDGTLARQALAHGDATTQALEYRNPEGGLPSARELPELLQQVRAAALVSDQSSPKGGDDFDGVRSVELQARLFIELDGLDFVVQLRNRAPWGAVDEVWRSPPESTEQILHPDKYRRAEKPDDVGTRVPAQLAPGWNVVYRDTLGEWGMRLFLTPAVGEYRAQRGATGWGGDQLMLLRGWDATGPQDAAPPPGEGGTTFATWITTWDDETDAEDFAVQAGRALAVLARLTEFPAAAALSATEPRAVTDAAGRTFALQRHRRTVGLVFAGPPSAPAMLARLVAAVSASAPASTVTGAPRPRAARPAPPPKPAPLAGPKPSGRVGP